MYKKYIILFLGWMMIPSLEAQTTATDFTTNDCNGVTHNLFDSLDAGNIIVIAWVMPCGPCSTYTIPAYSAAQDFMSSNSADIDFYLVDDYANTSCASLINWGNVNGMPLNTPFSSSDISMSDYGMNGMPKVVVLAGEDHTVFYNDRDDKINYTGVYDALNNAYGNLSSVDEKKNSFSFKLLGDQKNKLLKIQMNTISKNDFSFTVLDISGKSILNFTEQVYSSNLIKEIDLSHVESGIYFISISSETENKSLKFILN